MARYAGQRNVGARKRIARVFQVIELGVEPTVHGVAGFACRREVEPHVINDRSKKVFLVAGIAGGGQTRELTRCRILMALLAFHQGMRPYQRKTILMILDRLQRDLPPFDRMATFAVRSELATMDVSMAVRAVCTDIFEYQAGVALGTSHFLVHPAQRVTGVIMIEFGIRTDGFPIGIGMAVRARNGDRTMGVGHLRLRCAHCGAHGVSRRLNRHAAKHRGQPKGYRNEPAYAVHRSLRANGLRKMTDPA